MRVKQLLQLLTGMSPKDAATLWNDESSRPLLQQTMADHLLGDRPVFFRPVDQMLILVSQAHFADSEEECADVAHILCVPPQDTLPLISEHHGWGLATRCLIGLSFFYPAMEARFRRGYPNPKYYRQVGKVTFSRCGKPELDSHFENWEMFIGEHFPIS